MLVAVVLAWVFMAMAADQAGRFVYITLHKSIGQTIFFLTLFRLIWRRFHSAPPMGWSDCGVGGTDRAGESLVALHDHDPHAADRLRLGDGGGTSIALFLAILLATANGEQRGGARCAAGPFGGAISRLRDGWPARGGLCLARRRPTRWDS
jgi:hypothetical protein